MADPRTYVVTGSASGIGKYVTTGLISRGHRVLATDINQARLEELARNWPRERVRTRAFDVRDPAAWHATIEEAVATFGAVDVLYNIAGYMKAGLGYDAPPDDVHRHFDINTKGVIFGTQAAARHMVRQRQGHIINISSMSAMAAIPGIALYSASKFAVRAYSLAIAYELRKSNVAITVVCPDSVDTPMIEGVRSDDASAIVFSGPRLLPVNEIGDLLLGRVLAKRPLEVVYPKRRGWLARVANDFPNVALQLGAMMEHRGLRHLSALRGQKQG